MSGRTYPIKQTRDYLINPEKYKQLYTESIQNPDAFWGKIAEENLLWHKKWESVKNTSFTKDNVHIKWFEGGKLNVAENCLDRHVKTMPDKIAIIWEPDDAKDQARIFTYKELHELVCQAANMLISMGVKYKDRVTIYLPMIPEAAIAMLACARIGAIHSVVFGGFSANALHGRLLDSQSEIIITADETLRGGKHIPLKKNADEAIEDTKVRKLIVVKHSGGQVAWDDSKDFWWHEKMKKASNHHVAESFDADHPLFILYTSGSTGLPKGLLHSSAGYLLYAMTTFKYVFDYQNDDIFWCSADVGWITGHSYVLYGALAAGATSLMYEGLPNFPDSSRYWQIIDKHKVTQFYTSPTALRSLMREGDSFLQTTKRDSLKILGSVGEPINPEAWEWFHDKVGKGNCTIVDTWWQTETGGHLITPIPGAIPTKPGSATLPFFGVQPALVGSDDVESETEGALCIKDSWPGQAMTIWGDHNRFFETYFKPFPGYYFSGDAARRDDDGYYWIEGRMDDVINVSGHRISTAEVEAAINAHMLVAESAVVGYPHDIKGTGIYAYIITKKDAAISEKTKDDIRATVREIIGALAMPEKMQFVQELPKTRSGKIMRRILRKIAAGEVQSKEDFAKLGDISTLLNPDYLQEIVKGKV